MTPEQLAAAFTAAGFTPETLTAALRFFVLQQTKLGLGYQIEALNAAQQVSQAAADSQRQALLAQIAAIDAELTAGH